MATTTEIRKDIQTLRALAVVSVVLYHAHIPMFSGGYIGVDIFFVISGYLITGILMRELENTGKLRFANFYARRIRRLLPAAFLVFAVTLGVVAFIFSPLEQVALVRSFVSTTFYVSNLWFAHNATDYLATGVHLDPFLHTWSLSVEEQFYLVWPLLLVLAVRSGRESRSLLRATFAMATVFTLSFIGMLWLMDVSQPWAFFASPARAWEFASGGLIYNLHSQGRLRLLFRRDSVALIGLLLIFTPIFVYDDNTVFPGLAALVPVIGTSLVLIGGGGGPLLSRLHSVGLLQTMGNVSYSWYLWHWPIFVIPAALHIELNGPERFMGVVLSFLLAWVTYHTIENRARFSGFIASSLPRSYALCGTLMMASLALGLSVRFLAKTELQAPSQVALANVRDDIPRLYADNCHTDTMEVHVANCEYGAKAARRTMVLFGDSHAAQWFPALERAASEFGWRLVPLTKSACPAPIVAVKNRSLGREYSECQEWREQALSKIHDLGPQLIVVSNYHGFFDEVGEDAWRMGYEHMLSRLATDGVELVVLGDTPTPGFDMPTCVSRALWQGKPSTDCDLNRAETLNERAQTSEEGLVHDYSGVRFIDTSSLFCNQGTCPATIGGKLVYRDEHHITAEISRKSYLKLWKMIDSALH